MKKVFPLILAMLAAVCVPRIGWAYFGMESIPYSIVISGNTLEEIVCQAALVFHGSGYWEEAEVITAGCEILENQIFDRQQVVSASVMVGSYDVDEGVPREAGSGFYPVRLTLQKDADGRYDLLSYLYPEDGTLYAKQSKTLFPAAFTACSLMRSKIACCFNLPQSMRLLRRRTLSAHKTAKASGAYGVRY